MFDDNYQTTKVFICDDCEENFVTAYELRVHQENVHMKVGNYECRICNTKFVHIEKLTNHVEDTHQNTSTNNVTEEENTEVEIEDEIVSNSTLEPITAEGEVSPHEKEKNLKCGKCENTFQSKRALRLHVKTIHDGPRKFECDICQKRFNQKIHLRRHFSKCHLEKDYKNLVKDEEKPQNEGFKTQFSDKINNGQNSEHDNQDTKSSKKMNYPCSQCVKTYKYLQDLKIHIASIHKGEKHLCKKCEKSFQSKKALSLHAKTIHEGPKKFKCDICNKRFNQKAHLRSHLSRRHLEKNCRTLVKDEEKKQEEKEAFLECMKPFASKENLRVHLKTAHQKEKNYKCDKCEKSFGQFSSLDRHLTTVHLKEKNYKCEQCGKYFGQIATLKRHFENVHEGIRKYKCNECPAVFAEKRQLEKHSLKHNNGK